MTPERRAEIKQIALHYSGQCGARELTSAFTDLLAEIDRLNKVVSQACEIIDELLGDEDRPLKTRPALAAELERRSKS